MKDENCAVMDLDTISLLIWMARKFARDYKGADLILIDSRRISFLVSDPEKTRKQLETIKNFKSPFPGYHPRIVDGYEFSGKCAVDVWFSLEAARMIAALKEKLK